MNRPIQYFSDDYLTNCKKMTTDQIALFLDHFRLLHGFNRSKKRLISLRISDHLLQAVKIKSKAMGMPYQTQIQRILEAWVNKFMSSVFL